MSPSNENPKGLLYAIAGLIAIGLGASLFFMSRNVGESTLPAASLSPVPTDPNAPPASPVSVDLSTDDQGLSKSKVVIETSKGVIKFRFYTKDAPRTVQRFVELVQSGFYNGLTFHRVEPGFVIQGGDPQGNGTGGSGQKLPAEFNAREHIAGTVAMARAMDPNSADSQFYISLGRHPHLDNNYTVFGQVSEGLDVVRQIEVGDRMTSVRME